MKVTPQDQPGVTWRPWTLRLPCVLAFLWSVLVIVAANALGSGGSARGASL